MTLRVSHAPENAGMHGQETVTFREGVVPVPGKTHFEKTRLHEVTYDLHNGREPQQPGNQVPQVGGGEVNVGYNAGLPNLNQGKGREI